MPNASSRRICALLLLWSVVASPAFPATAYPDEAVKAAFLHRFASYVEWPADQSRQAPFVIGVFGADGIAKQLGELLPGLLIHETPAELRKVDERTNLNGVRILYIGSGSLRRARNLLARASNRPILIVTDDPNGTARGATINFVEVEHHIRFEVSLPAALHSRLKVDSGLLAVAERVIEAPQKDGQKPR